MKRISVIVTAYNEEKYILECLKSIANQTYKNIEIILVNDGSTDNTLLISQDYLKTVSLPYLIISEDNKGVSAARNIGLKHASGDYIKFLDGDDTLKENALEEMLKTALKYDAEVVKTSLNVMYKHFNLKNGYNTMNNKPKQGIIINDHKDFIVFEAVGIGNKLYKRSILEGIEFPTFKEKRIPEDLAVTPLILAKSNVIGIAPKSLVNYRKHQESLTHTRTIDESIWYLNSLKALDYLENLFRKHNLYQDYQEQLAKINMTYRFLESIGMLFQNDYPIKIKLNIFRRLTTLAYNNLQEASLNPEYYHNEYIWWYYFFSKVFTKITQSLNLDKEDKELIEEIKELHLKR